MLLCTRSQSKEMTIHRISHHMSRSCHAFLCPWTVSPLLTSQRCHSCQSTLSDAHVFQHFPISQYPGFHLTLYEGNMSWPVIHSSRVQFRREVGRKGGFNFLSGKTILQRRIVRFLSTMHVQLCHSGVARSRSTLYLSLPAFLLFWSGKHMRDSNLHFNYIAQVIRCYLALVIECALRQPSATVKQPLESHSLSVCACVWVLSICVCLCVCVCVSLCACVCVCVWKRDSESWRNGETNRPTERLALFISITHVFANRVQYLTSVCHCADSYHYISFTLQWTDWAVIRGWILCIICHLNSW